MDLLISLDTAHARRQEGPDYGPAPVDKPIWALRTVEATAEDWDLTVVGEGLTKAEAYEMADERFPGLRFLE